MAPRLLVGVSGVAVVPNVALLGLLAVEEPRTFAVWVALVAAGGGYHRLRSRDAPAGGDPLVERAGDP
jgi:hypothetical protein